MTIDHVSDGMEPFATTVHATCGLASRYDGLDLPGNACRVVVLEGKPDQDNLQDRFLSERVRAGAAIAERIRTRAVQGAGRCTRGPNDWAVVVVLGADLTKYLLWPETQRALEPELQAEIQFGVKTAKARGRRKCWRTSVFFSPKATTGVPTPNRCSPSTGMARARAAGRDRCPRRGRGA